MPKECSGNITRALDSNIGVISHTWLVPISGSFAVLPPIEGSCSTLSAPASLEAGVCRVPEVDSWPDVGGMGDALGLLSCMISVWLGTK
jgi:hypothetical protein